MSQNIISARPGVNTRAGIEYNSFRDGLHNKSDDELRDMLNRNKGLTDIQITAIRDELAARSAETVAKERPAGMVEAERVSRPDRI